MVSSDFKECSYWIQGMNEVALDLFDYYEQRSAYYYKAGRTDLLHSY